MKLSGCTGRRPRIFRISPITSYSSKAAVLKQYKDNIEEFKKGRIRHNIMGSIIEANLVFLDELGPVAPVIVPYDRGQRGSD